MSRIGWGRTKSGRVLASAGALALAVGLGGCLGPGSSPPPNTPPGWHGTTVSFLHTPTGPAGAATGWITTVTVPACSDNETATTIVGSASNGFLIPLGNSQFSWTRQVTGSPAQRVAGTFTADCKDFGGLFAHPTLTGTAT